MSILSARLRYGVPLIMSAGLTLVVACSSDSNDGGSAGSPGVAGNPGTGGVAGNGGGAVAGATATAGSGGSVAGSPAVGAGEGGTAGTGTGGGAAGTPGAGTGGATAGSGGASGGSAGDATGGADGGSAGAPTGGTGGGSSKGGEFTLTSPDLAEGAKFDAAFTCASGNGQLGKGDNPELNWSGVPDGTKSLAITFIDITLGEDSQFGQHWAIWNIPWDAATGEVSKLPRAAPSKSVPAELSPAKQSGAYLSPCAQSLMNGMDDEYVFTIYALPTATLAITGTSVANALTALRAAQPLGKATLKGHAGLKGG